MKKSMFCWEIPMGCIPGMRVPGRIYANEHMIQGLRSDGSLRQVANAATLPGATMASLAMPDIHFGYGLPIGGVLASRTADGVISPGGVGFDINCGVRMLATPLTMGDVKSRLRPLVEALFRHVPAGVGSAGKLHLKRQDIRNVMVTGARWAVESGYGVDQDLEHCESGGWLKGADPDRISDRALERGADQLGTLGSGNHFIEVQAVTEIH
ncbi:MAG TPA: RtcB family protein, partial [bacterium]|nr:RtcB family protein [bacterium]